MTDILFYHLERQPLERVLPSLLEKSLERGWRALVRTPSQERVQAIDETLWTSAEDGFLPHALPGEPRLAALVGAVTDRQYAARDVALRHLRTLAYGRLMLQATALLHRPPFNDVASMETIAVFAKDSLKRLRKKVRGLAQAASTADPASLHRLRIGIKRLRYALEFFAPLSSGPALQRLLTSLSSLQDELGQLNDLANAGVLLMHCAGDDAPLREAVSLVGGWHASRYGELLALIPERIGKLRRISLPTLG